MGGRFGKGQVAGVCRVGRGQAGQEDRPIAIDFSLDSFGNFGGSIGNGNKEVR
jgi:hypothetical protein